MVKKRRFFPFSVVTREAPRLASFMIDGNRVMWMPDCFKRKVQTSY